MSDNSVPKNAFSSLKFLTKFVAIYSTWNALHIACSVTLPFSSSSQLHLLLEFLRLLGAIYEADIIYFFDVKSLPLEGLCGISSLDRTRLSPKNYLLRLSSRRCVLSMWSHQRLKVCVRLPKVADAVMEYAWPELQMEDYAESSGGSEPHA